MPQQLKELACQAIDLKKEELNEISQEIWKNPELYFEEFKAHQLLTNYFEKEGFKVEKQTPLETSFIARYGDSKGLKIGICCEYDALPGVGHACGHNLIAETGVGAALGLKAVSMKYPEKFNIVVYGAPAEESGSGKVIMIEKGVFDEIDICMMSHPTPYEIPTPFWLSEIESKIVFKGKPAHAAAAPWEGINALDAAVMCYNNLSMLRQQMKPTCRMHFIFVDGGQRPNIIPERSELWCSVRGVTDKDADELFVKLKSCAEGAAVASGCSVEVVEMVPRCSAVKTNQRIIELYIKNAKSLGVQFNDDEMTEKLLASTDMGNVSQIKPSIHPLFRIETEGPLHTHKFAEAARLEENQLPALNSAKSMAMTAIDIVNDDELIKRIHEEFQK